MNTGFLFSGILALVIGILVEVGARISRSSSWYRARVLIAIGIALMILSILYP